MVTYQAGPLILLNMYERIEKRLNVTSPRFIYLIYTTQLVQVPSRYIHKAWIGHPCFKQKKLVTTDHDGLTGKLGKSVQYKINNFCLCRPRFHLPDISNSSRTVHIFVQPVTYLKRAEQLDGQIEYILADIYLPEQLRVLAK